MTTTEMLKEITRLEYVLSQVKLDLSLIKSLLIPVKKQKPRVKPDYSKQIDASLFKKKKTS